MVLYRKRTKWTAEKLATLTRAHRGQRHLKAFNSRKIITIKWKKKTWNIKRNEDFFTILWESGARQSPYISCSPTFSFERPAVNVMMSHIWPKGRQWWRLGQLHRPFFLLPNYRPHLTGKSSSLVLLACSSLDSAYAAYYHVNCC